MTAQTVPRVRPIRVLLVEDNPGDARLIAEMLHEVSGEFEVHRVDRLKPALERLNAAGADAVLLDLGLPDSQGLATFEKARQGAPNEPIIVISGLDDEDLALKAVRSGAQDYLVKGRIVGQLLARVIRYAIERQRHERQLRWLTQAVEQSPASVFITNPQGIIEYVNPTFTAVTGYSAAEAIGQTPRILKSGLTPPDYYERLWRTISAGETWRAEVRNRRKNGELYWDEVVIAPIRDALGEVVSFLAVQQDVTHRKEVEDALAASERRLRALFETVNLIVLALNQRGQIDYVNPFFLTLGGYSREEVLGKDWFQFLPPRVRPALHVTFEQLLQQGMHPHYENPILTKEGRERLVAWHNTVLRDSGGTPIGTLSVGEDITERTLLQQQLQQAQKMEAIGRLAGGVAHDFNNLLTAIFGYAEFAAEELAADNPIRQDIEEIRNAAQRASALTRQLLAFSRQQVLEPVVLSLNALVEDIDKMLRRLIGEDVALQLSLKAGLGNVRADPGQVQQVLLNLVVNARDAMPTGGRLLIETGDAELTEHYATLHQPVVPGPYVMLAVSDTGTGMSAEVKARIFEPFFTTKEKGKGTGLGLSTVYGIVKQSGGYIWVYTEEGRGTTFKVYLPRVEAGVDELIARPEPESLTGTETILIAEDDAMLRPLARTALEKLGYTVLEAASAEEAAIVAGGYAGTIHLLVTDVVMPGASGRDLARRLSTTRPDTKVLYMSGYTDDAIINHGMLEPGLHFLQKPFTPATLARKVREVLESQ